MTDIEKAFTDALRRVDTMEVPFAPPEPGGLDGVPRTPLPGRRRPARWLAAAAAVVLLAGAGVWYARQQPGTVPATPVASPSLTAAPVTPTPTPTPTPADAVIVRVVNDSSIPIIGVRITAAGDPISLGPLAPGEQTDDLVVEPAKGTKLPDMPLEVTVRFEDSSLNIGLGGDGEPGLHVYTFSEPGPGTTKFWEAVDGKMTGGSISGKGRG